MSLIETYFFLVYEMNSVPFLSLVSISIIRLTSTSLRLISCIWYEGRLISTHYLEYEMEGIIVETNRDLVYKMDWVLLD